ncbi:MAG TPA: ATP-binding protein [Burkholderiales bacterium]|nr:ATP-binding protein [Burkholderiales bacterium]
MKLGIRAKLFLVSLALIAISVVATEAYLSRSLEQQLTARTRTELVVRARLIAERAGALPAGLDDAAAADALADALGRIAGARVTLVRRDGTVAGDSEVAASALAAIENHGMRPEIVEAFTDGEGSSVRYSTTLGRRMMYVAVPVVRQQTAVGTARIALPLTDLDEALAEMRRTLLIGALVALLVAILISLSAAQLTARRLLDLAHAARRIAAGDLGTRTRASGNDEIAALGHAMDHLSESLSRTLHELRSERDVLTGILSSMNEGVLVVGEDGRIALTNPALRAMLLLGSDAVGKSILQVIRNADLNELLQRAADRGDSEAELDLAGLRPRRVLVRAVKLHDSPGGVLAVVVDVTELRRLEAVRRDFVANASHELRSPLTTVRAAAETLRTIENDPAAADRFITLIERNAERLAALIDDLLELSRIESRELRLEMERLELAPVVERVVIQHAHRAQVRGITLTQALGGVPYVRADRRALEHVLGNLIDNALKYCPRGATVKVTASAENDTVRLSVIDTGPGIAAEHLPRLFERFYRVDAGRSRELGGTGLGLAIVKHLVEAMGGEVSVTSTAGAGSTFSFTLPRA